MYPDVHFLGGKLITVGEVRVTTEDPRMRRRLMWHGVDDVKHRPVGNPKSKV
jgi:predicted metal-dependent hydrolase